MKTAALALSLLTLLAAGLAGAQALPLAQPALSGPVTQSDSAPPPTIQDGLGPGSALQQHDDAGDAGGYICTAAFLLRDPVTATYYLSTAGHCLVLDADDPEAYTGAAEPDKLKEEILVCVASCIANAVGLGTYVTLRAGDGYHPVTYARSGGVGEDFGILEIPDEHRELLRPSMPQWGGTTAIADDGSGLLVHYGHGSYCCPVTGALATRTPADQGRVGYFVSSDGSSFQGVGWVTGGDSGSAIAWGVPDATGLVRGTAALGVITHATEGTGSLFSGTLLSHGLEMVLEGTGLRLELVLEGDPLDAAPQGLPGGNGTHDVSILTPAPGATVRPVGGAVRIEGAARFGASGNGTRVEVAIDDPSYGFDSRLAVTGEEIWEALWFPGTAAVGVHTLRARLVGPDGEVLDQVNQTVRLERAGSGGRDTSGGDGGTGNGTAGGDGPISVDIPGVPAPLLVLGLAAAVATAARLRRRGAS